MGNVQHTEQADGLWTRIVGIARGKSSKDPASRAIANARRAVATQMRDGFGEDPKAAAEYTAGMRSRRGYTLTKPQAFDILDALWRINLERGALLERSLTEPDLDITELLETDIVDLIVGEKAIKDGLYADCRWSVYELLREAKAHETPQLSGIERPNALPVSVIYFSVPPGSEYAEILERLMKRAHESLPKGMKDLVVPEFVLRFIGFNEEVAT